MGADSGGSPAASQSKPAIALEEAIGLSLGDAFWMLRPINGGDEQHAQRNDAARSLMLARRVRWCKTARAMGVIGTMIIAFFLALAGTAFFPADAIAGVGEGRGEATEGAAARLAGNPSALSLRRLPAQQPRRGNQPLTVASAKSVVPRRAEWPEPAANEVATQLSPRSPPSV